MTRSSQARIRPNALDGGQNGPKKQSGRAVNTKVQPPEAPAFLISHTECWLGEGTKDVVASSKSSCAVVGVRMNEVSSNYILNNYFLFVSINIRCALKGSCFFELFRTSPSASSSAQLCAACLVARVVAWLCFPFLAAVVRLQTTVLWPSSATNGTMHAQPNST